MLRLAVFCCLLSVILGHMCLLSPHQRGSMTGINTPGATDCILLKGPCGQRQAAASVVSFKAGSMANILIQKNLDHYDKASPGFFNVSMGMNAMDLKPVAMIKDMGEPSLHLYSAMVQIPKTPAATYILQATYVTKNPKAPAVFYQCADISILA